MVLEELELYKRGSLFSVPPSSLDTYSQIRGCARRLKMEEKEELVGVKADPKI